MKTTEAPIIIEELFNVPAKTVWDAITDIHKMRQWFFENIEDFKPEIGFKTQFNVQSENSNFIHLWTITEVEPFKKITYNWKYKNFEGDSLVHFELFEAKNNTLLRLTTQIIEDFSTNIPEFKRESCIEGWNYFIKQNLKNFLEK